MRPHITIVFPFEMDITNEELSIIIEYSNEFSAFDLGLPYIPHMTVGKLDDAKQLNDAFNSVKDNEAVFKSRITKISVEMIGENEESIIIIEKQLC